MAALFKTVGYFHDNVSKRLRTRATNAWRVQSRCSKSEQIRKRNIATRLKVIFHGAD